MKSNKSRPDERRKRRRLPLQRVIRHSVYQVLGTPVFQENTTLDVSTGGVSFETAHEYRKGTLVLMELELDGVETRLLVVVAWVKKVEDKFQIGAELIAIDPTHQKHLQTVVGKLIRKSSKSGSASPKKPKKKRKVSLRKKTKNAKKKKK